jgi:lipopolysaccharide assembly outer membrane protein LptD (OstA)
MSLKNNTKIIFKLYYFNEKRLAVVFLLTVHCLMLFSQEGKVTSDSLKIKGDSTISDTTFKSLILAKDAVDKPITHTAKGYRLTDFITKKVYLVGEAEVKYDDITLKADSIVLNMETGEVYATGRPDSTGKLVGTPVFTQGQETFDSKELTYNFKSKMARVLNMSTKQEEGFLHSGITKKLDDGSLNISLSTYSTCDATPPHFYVGFKKAKVVPGKKIITGPAYMVIEDIPLPIVIPFGFFPIQKKTAASGILIPKIGQTFELGYSLREGGYYFALSDNFDLAVTGDIYTNGTWLVNATSAYVKKYKYSGRVSLSFANNVSGHKGLPDYSKSNNYKIDWAYNQDAKANPGSRFAANVSMSSSSYDKTNSYNPMENINTQRQSSISYSKSWEGTPFNFSTSLNHSQNVSNKTVFLNLPKAYFSMQRIYPLKNKKSAGPTKWYQDLQFQYTASVDNQINTYDSLLFTSEVFNNMKNGFKHDAPLSLQIRPFKSIPSFSISPQMSYSAVLYTQKINRSWDPNYFDADLNKVVPSVITDTLRGAFYGQSVNASVSAGLSPQLFGTYSFKNPNSRVQFIRHIIKPSIGFSYVPYLSSLTTDMYRTVQADTTGRMQTYSIFEGNIYGTPSAGQRSGGITFSLVNILEAKVLEKNDTTGKPKKVKIIDNFTMNTSYNIFADSIRWAPLTMNYRTVLFQNFNIASSAVFSFYGMNSKGAGINTSWFAQTGKPLRMTGVSASLDFDLSKLVKKKKGSSATTNTPPNTQQLTALDTDNQSAAPARTPAPPVVPTVDRYGYADFELPWTMNVAYNIYYTKPGLQSTLTQTLSMNGSVTLTKKTSISYTTGFDIARGEITMTSIGIVRDLHCWEMSVNWIPIGYLKSWDFTIRVKASMLKDVKYNRRKDFRDQY